MASDFTYTEKWRCAEREIKQREKVYRRLVDTGAMPPEQAEREIALMKAIRDDYFELSKGERLL